MDCVQRDRASALKPVQTLKMCNVSVTQSTYNGCPIPLVDLHVHPGCVPQYTNSTVSPLFNSKTTLVCYLVWYDQQLGG